MASFIDLCLPAAYLEVRLRRRRLLLAAPNSSSTSSSRRLGVRLALVLVHVLIQEVAHLDLRGGWASKQHT